MPAAARRQVALVFPLLRSWRNLITGGCRETPSPALHRYIVHVDRCESGHLPLCLSSRSQLRRNMEVGFAPPSWIPARSYGSVTRAARPSHLLIIANAPPSASRQRQVDDGMRMRSMRESAELCSAHFGGAHDQSAPRRALANARSGWPAESRAFWPPVPWSWLMSREFLGDSGPLTRGK